MWLVYDTQIALGFKYEWRKAYDAKCDFKAYDSTGHNINPMSNDSWRDSDL